MKKLHSIFLPAVVAGIASVLACGFARADVAFVVNNGDSTVSEISGGVVSTFISSDLNSPTGIAIYGNDIFVGNNGTDAAGYIAEFTLGGAFVANYSTGELGPRGMTFDSAGNLYVTDENNGQILEIPTGGGAGSVVASGLSFPEGVAFNGGTLYAVEAQNGGRIDTIAGGVATPIITGLDDPNGLAFDNSGNLYVVDTGTSSVAEYTAGGTLINPDFITQASGRSPRAIAVDSSGDFYVTDEGAESTVTEYGPTGNIIAVFSSGFNGPNSVVTLAVPEPSTYALVIVAAGLLFFMGRRKTAKA